MTGKQDTQSVLQYISTTLVCSTQWSNLVPFVVLPSGSGHINFQFNLVSRIVAQSCLFLSLSLLAKDEKVSFELIAPFTPLLCPPPSKKNQCTLGSNPFLHHNLQLLVSLDIHCLKACAKGQLISKGLLVSPNLQKNE